MSDWDDSDDVAVKVPSAPPKAPIKKKWADEDEDEEDKDVASDWEESSEEEEEKPKPISNAAPPKKKMSVKQKLAEKAAAREAKIAAGESTGSDTEDDIIDPALKKKLDKEKELAADLKNASDLLGAAALGSSSSKELDALITANPRTKEQLLDLSQRILDLIVKRLETNPLYAQFVEHHVRELARPLRDVEIRKAATALTTLANEKQKEQREGKKKKGASKPMLGSSKPGKVDTRAYEEALDDFGKDADDFM